MEGALLSQIPLWATGAQVHVETAILPEGPGSRGMCAPALISSGHRLLLGLWVCKTLCWDHAQVKQPPTGHRDISRKIMQSPTPRGKPEGYERGSDSGPLNLDSNSGSAILNGWPWTSIVNCTRMPGSLSIKMYLTLDTSQGLWRLKGIMHLANLAQCWTYSKGWKR